MANKPVIDIHNHNDQEVVDTFELYVKIGLDLSHYSRWIRNARARGGKDIDWFINADLLKKNRRIKQRYYFTLDFARAMCIKYKTKGSNELVVFLKEEEPNDEIIDLGNNRGILKCFLKGKNGEDLYYGPEGLVSEKEKATNFPLIHKFKQEQNK